MAATASSPAQRPEVSSTQEARTRASPPQGDGGEPPQRTPFLLDFYPLEDAHHTRISRFFDELRAGRFVTTWCPRDQKLLWPPRVVCPDCHGEDLSWKELPRSGHLYAFSAVLAGAPLGMESQVPFVVGLVELQGVPLRIFSRIAPATYDRLEIGDPVELETYPVPGDRVFFRFRPTSPR